MKNIRENLDYLKRETKKFCLEKEVIIVAVTKFAKIEEIREAIVWGIKDIGENKVQEAEKKFSLLPKNNISSHMVGHLQINKVKKAVRLFDLIHSIDSYNLALEINKEASKIGKTQDILIQVNISKEKSKRGIYVEEVLNVVKKITYLTNVSLKGLMTIAPFVSEEVVLRNCFRSLKNLHDTIIDKGINLKYLSMGMSNDYKIALQEGANMLRLGSAIFR